MGHRSDSSNCPSKGKAHPEKQVKKDATLKSSEKLPPEVLLVHESPSNGKAEPEKQAIERATLDSSDKQPPKLLGVGEIDAIGHEINPLGKRMSKKQYDKRKSFGEDIAELFPERRVCTNESTQESEVVGNDLNVDDYKNYLKSLRKII